ncbi:MAG: hypothetical protein NTV22_15235 [bacterium]|nr:hypothetical protein [bacterium]
MNLNYLEKRLQRLAPAASAQLVFISVTMPTGETRALIGGAVAAGAIVPPSVRIVAGSTFDADTEQQMAGCLLDDLADRRVTHAELDDYQLGLMRSALKLDWPSRNGQPARVILEPY